MAQFDANKIAQQIAVNPRQRADFFRDPNKAVSSAVPKEAKADSAAKQEVVEAVNQIIEKDPGEMKSAVLASRVTEEFFRAAMRNPERSFDILVWMAIVAFLIGVTLITLGGVFALILEDETEKIISGVFGASGVLATLASTYTLTTRGVSKANADNAQIRLIIADFATELGHLRAIQRGDTLEKVSAVNKEIRAAMSQAVKLIHDHVRGDDEES